MISYHCAVNNQRGRDLEDFTLNFLCLHIFLSQKKLNLVGNCTGTCRVTTGGSPVDALVRREGGCSCVAEDITQTDFGKERSSNCDTKRHCRKSLRAGVEQKEC